MIHRSALVAAFVATGLGACDRVEPPADGLPSDAVSAQRILAVAPSIAEVLFALDLDERVVAVGDYTEWPPEAAAKPRVGGLFNPRLEEIVALEPDLAVLLPSEQRLAGELARLGIETLIVEHETLADIEDSILAVATRAGIAERGRQLAESLRRELAPRSATAPRRVLLLVARERGRLAQLTAVGSGTFLAELVDRLGVENVLADAAQPYPQVGLETVLERRPEVIVELQPHVPTEADREELIEEWSRFPLLPAVAHGCVVVVAGGHVLLPGPRLPRLMRELEAAIEGCGQK